MAYAAMKPTKPGLEEAQEQIHKIRITLSSKNVKNLEKGSSLISYSSLDNTLMFFYICHNCNCILRMVMFVIILMIFSVCPHLSIGLL